MLELNIHVKFCSMDRGPEIWFSNILQSLFLSGFWVSQKTWWVGVTPITSFSSTNISVEKNLFHIYFDLAIFRRILFIGPDHLRLTDIPFGFINLAFCLHQHYMHLLSIRHGLLCRLQIEKKSISKYIFRL